MDDAPGVCEGERGTDALTDLRRSGRLERPVLPEDVGQRPPLDVFHHDVVRAVVRAGVENRHDVRMAEASRGSSLPAEPRHERLVPGVLRRQHLHGHRPPEHAIRPPVHGGHAPAPDRLEHVVPLTEEGLLLRHPGSVPHSA